MARGSADARGMEATYTDRTACCGHCPDDCPWRPYEGHLLGACSLCWRAALPRI